MTSRDSKAGGPFECALERQETEREVVLLSESRRVESPWVRTAVREEKSGRLVATTPLNGAVMKASYPSHEQELAALTQGEGP